jgi:hypothetical protein
VPESVAALLGIIGSGPSARRYEICVSYLEIYNEQVMDLLGGEGTPEVKLREDADGQLQLTPLSSHRVTTPDEVLEHLVTGETRRRKGETRMNEMAV